MREDKRRKDELAGEGHKVTTAEQLYTTQKTVVNLKNLYYASLVVSSCAKIKLLSYFTQYHINAILYRRGSRGKIQQNGGECNFS